ncbi:hypothetical protein GALMADRAFT_142864 [Galerina marginata CBS 339.88]|uniref:FIST domain-containing protein n=1 Tax=Galerina marginata (strain CBS 339.88) TaxID=685588 RepID=A0A067SNS3_GALM3|nr:hypothetical protein GALMADRAFT_142864 [Galerina marginata CBS 339.88]
MPPLHLSTVLTRKPSNLLSHISKVSREYAGKGHTLLFTLSSNFTLPQDLQAVVERLTKFNDVGDVGERTEKGKGTNGHTIGCLTDSFASTTFENLPVTKEVDQGPLLSCSLGIFDSKLCMPYRSELPGREQPQVGRWHSFRKKEVWAASAGNGGSGLEKPTAEGWEPDWQNIDTKGNEGGTDWERIWNRSVSASSLEIGLFPENLRAVKPNNIRALLSFSSSHPDSFTRSLSMHLPNSPSLTVIAAPTHFITGRGVTLFLDGRIYDDGAIGLALLKNAEAVGQTAEEGPAFRTEFLNVRRLSGPMTVTSREGNMINTLNSSNPTKLLLSALELAGISPLSASFKDEDQFALGVLAPDGQISRTHKITAGDPSARGGSLSMDALAAPDVGSVVQFLHFPSTVPLTFPMSLLPSLMPSNNTDAAPNSSKVFAALTVPEASTPQPHSASHTPSSETSNILDDTFLVPSSQGFVLSQGLTMLSVPEDVAEPVEAKVTSPSPWTCSVPGSTVLLEWD